ncbi:MAG: glycosyltransferase family 4 protein [Caldilineaceae bacterium]
MHILFVTGEYPPLRGGVGAYTAELAQALAAIGTQVSVVTSTTARDDANLPMSSSVQCYPVIHRWDWVIGQQIPVLARQIGADWCHVQYQTAAFAMHPAINFAPFWWRKVNRGMQVAWTYHDLLVPYLFPKAGARLRRWVTERPAHSSHVVITTNAGDYQQLAAKGLSALYKIPIGSNIALPKTPLVAPSVLRARLGYAPTALLIGYFGFLNRSKGGLTLIHTLHRLVERGHDAHLRMIGERVGASDPTNFSYLQEVEALIAAYGLTDRVRWTGHLDDAAVSENLLACDLLLLPYVDGASLRRGTLMAGLAHGCAIVTTTPQAPLPELVAGADLWYVPPEDPDAAAHAVAQLAANPGLRSALGEQAQRKSRQFTWPAIAQQHLAAYGC